MKIAIIGAGAVGCYYGARLAAAGNEVTFLMRGDYEVVSRQGLRVESVHGDLTLKEPRVVRASSEMGCVDLVVVAWKTTANDSYGEVLSPLMGEGTRIVTLQNGLGNVERLQGLFGEERVLGGLCFVCINRIEPGLIRHTGGGKIAVGGPSEPRREVVSVFQEAGIFCEEVGNLGEAQWRKLVWNVPFNGLCITEGGIDTQQLLGSEGGERRVRELMEEVLVGAEALGFEIEPGFIDYQIEITRPMGSYRPSSMIDYVAGRPVEVGAIWEEPLRRAEEAGASLPKLRALTESLRERCR